MHFFQVFGSLRLLTFTLSIAAISTSTFGYLIGDGRGIFQVVVRVESSDGRGFIEDATVTMLDAGRDEIASRNDLKEFAKLFDPAITNAAGDAIVYYYGGFSDETGKDMKQSVHGRLKVTKKGYADAEIQLSDQLGQNLSLADNRVPFVKVKLEKKP